MEKYRTFSFDRYTLDVKTKTANFLYSLDGGPTITETLTLDTQHDISVSPLIDRILFALHLILGISYWKAFCPENIVVRSGKLTKRQVQFWNTLYTKGLGQFFYENQLPWQEVQFPVTAEETSPASPLETSDTALVLLGGGKDSLVTLELCKKMQRPFTTFTFGQFPIIEEQRKHIAARHHTILRKIDPKLAEWNTQGAWNGHVPISAIYLFTALLVAALEGYRYLVTSNERSANEGNVTDHDKLVNHQWSKSMEFETLFQEYLHQSITPDISAFSLLRPLSELHIAELFSRMPQWHDHFTSCNCNFALNTAPKQRWCGTCAKCLFVFIVLSAFIPKQRLMSVFGSNLFADVTLVPLLDSLIGKTQKPFECVGTADETTLALVLAYRRGDYANDVLMQHFAKTVLPHIFNLDQMRQKVHTRSSEHAIPKPFQSFLHELPKLPE